MTRGTACWSMKVLVIPIMAAASIGCAAMTACRQIEVLGHVVAATGKLTLADLLTKTTCTNVQEDAARVILGTVPRSGNSRVLEGSELRGLLKRILMEESVSDAQAIPVKIPERVILEGAGAMKTCAEIAQFLHDAESTAGGAGEARGRWQELHCAAAQHIPEDAPLALTKKVWHANQQRWEFTLRCTRPCDCIPFLVWAKGEDAPSMHYRALRESPDVAIPQVVKPGQTALLAWNERGIRIVTRVTCLEGGGVGQLVRVRFKNGPGILQAEVLRDGTLRRSL